LLAAFLSESVAVEGLNMPEHVDDDEKARQVALERGLLVIDRLKELERAAAHLKAGGSPDDAWVKEALNRNDVE
jgi:hypothetical protein